MPSKYVIFPLYYHFVNWLYPHHLSLFCLHLRVETLGAHLTLVSSTFTTKLFASYLQLVTGIVNHEESRSTTFAAMSLTHIFFNIKGPLLLYFAIKRIATF